MDRHRKVKSCDCPHTTLSCMYECLRCSRVLRYNMNSATLSTCPVFPITITPSCVLSAISQLVLFPIPPDYRYSYTFNPTTTKTYIKPPHHAVNRPPTNHPRRCIVSQSCGNSIITPIDQRTPQRRGKARCCC